MRPWETFRSVVRFRRFETDPVARRLRTAITVDDMRRVARRRLPRGVFDYIDGGAEDERSLVNNAAAFGRLEFKPNVLRDVSAIDVSTTLLGRPLSMPLVLAPTGYTRLTHSEGRALGRSRRGPGGCPVLALDHEHAFDRGSRRRELRCQVVPGLHVEGPWPRRGAGRAGSGRRVRGAVAHRRHRRARPSRARHPARLLDPAEDRPGNDHRRDRPSGVDAGFPHPRTPDVRQRRPRARSRRRAATWAAAST